MDQQGQQDRNNRRRYVGSGRLCQQHLENTARELEQSQWSQEAGYNQLDSQNGSTRRPYVGSGRLSRQHLDNMAREQEWYDQPQPQNVSSMPPVQRQLPPQDGTTAPQQYAPTSNQFYQIQPRYNIAAPPAPQALVQSISYEVSPFTIRQSAPAPRDNYPPRVCRTPMRSPERQLPSAETSPSSKEVESLLFPQSANPQPTGVQGSPFRPIQSRSPPRSASGGRSPYSQREDSAQRRAEGIARECLMTPPDQD